MKKSMSILFTVLAMVLIAGVSLGIAGSPDVTFGAVTSAYYNDKTIFNAFELEPVVMDRCRGKGSMIYTAKRPGYTDVYYFDVEYVNAQPEIGQAWFAGICTHTLRNGSPSDINLGKWMFMHISDQGVGPANDGLSGGWFNTEIEAKEAVCKGSDYHPGALLSGDIVVQAF